MMEQPERIQELLRALSVMAERGTEHERKIAASKLHQILDKYDLTLGDMIDTATEECWFKYTTSMEKRLLHQIHSMVTNEHSGRYWQAPRKTKIGFDLTKIQHIEMQELWSAYRPALRDHIKMAYAAFVQKQRIFPDGSGEGQPELDPDYLERLVAMMGGIKKVDVRKQLSGGINGK